jgi:hypothetical protein
VCERTTEIAHGLKYLQEKKQEVEMLSLQLQLLKESANL